MEVNQLLQVLDLASCRFDLRLDLFDTDVFMQVPAFGGAHLLLQKLKLVLQGVRIAFFLLHHTHLKLLLALHVLDVLFRAEEVV